MKTRVFTLCWGTAYQRYGQTFIETFNRFWPKEIELVVVADTALPMPRGIVTELDDIPGVAEFRRRWSASPTANGKLAAGAGAKQDANGYSWQFDAVKWMPQAMAPLAALKGMTDGDILIWFDADVETIAKVPQRWAESIVGDADMVCLQRGDRHSEIGFYAVRVNPKTRAMLIGFAALYAGDAIFSLKQWHSAFAFDHAAAAVDGLKIKNLNAGGARGHVWPSIPELAKYTSHFKGKRKDKRAAEAKVK